MNRKDLADEIRGAGNALRFADGPVVGVTYKSGRASSLHGVRRKLKLSDWDIIEMAATCSSCDECASQYDIEFAEMVADCYQSFARLIWPCIDHEPNCPAEPYLSVSEKAQKRFANLKAKFEELRLVRSEGLSTEQSSPRNKKASKKRSDSSGSGNKAKRVGKKVAKKAIKRPVKRVAKKSAKKKTPRKKRD